MRIYNKNERKSKNFTKYNIIILYLRIKRRNIRHVMSNIFFEFLTISDLNAFNIIAYITVVNRKKSKTILMDLTWNKV